MASGATVAALNEQIESISELCRQSQTRIPHEWKCQKSAAQGLELDGLLDPIAQLPRELSSSIFELCLTNEAPGLSIADSSRKLSAPRLLVNVCHAWAEIAESTPALWTYTRVYPDRTALDGYTEAVDRWVSRSGDLPLAFTILSCQGSNSTYAFDLVHRHAQRIQLLWLNMSTEEYLERMVGSTQFPSMTRLTLRREKEVLDDFGGGFFMYGVISENISGVIRMLSAAPNLVGCRMYIDDFDNPPPTPFTHCALTHLYLGQFTRMPNSLSSSVILEHLTLPALEHLTVSRCWDSSDFDTLAAFLARSSTSLRSLHIIFSNSASPEITMDRFLALIPNVVDLYVLTDMRFARSLLRAIGSGSLPHIDSLTINTNEAGYRMDYEDLLTGLTAMAARSPMPSSFALLCWNMRRFEGWPFPGEVGGGQVAPVEEVVYRELTSEVLAGMRELVAKGMNIHVGYVDGKNFV